MKKKVFLFLSCLLLSISLVTAQTPATVQGVVTAADNGEPVIGASVLVKGTSVGSVTDIDGKFLISNVPATAKTLQVSFIGMQMQEVAIKSGIIKVELAMDSEMLEEVVIQVAYGTAKKTSLTGAISSVNVKEIEKRPVSSIAAALEGTTSGVQVNSTYGQPGDDPSIRIRGFGTVNGSSDPLYVIDGVPFGGNISDINPNDIESMSVLKDAASCALYGNRASNGVILITTKRGTSDKLSIDLKVHQGTYSRGIKEYKRVNPYQFMEVAWANMKNQRISKEKVNEAAAAAYASENLVSESLKLNIFNKADNALFDSNGNLVADAQILPGYADDLDWYDPAIRDGYRQEYTLSGNVANEKSSLYFSLGYLDENGYARNSDFNRLSARTSLTFTPKTWLKTGLNLSGTHQLSNYTNGDSSNGYTNVFMYARQIAPIYPVHLHNADGSYRLDLDGKRQYDPGYYINDEGTEIATRGQYLDRHVIWENELNMDKTFRNTLQSIAFLDIKFLKDFTFTLKGDLNIRNSEKQTYNNASIGDGKGNLGRASRTRYRYKNYTVQEQLSWNHVYGKHYVDALVAHENYYYNYSYEYGYKTSEVFTGKTHFSNFTNITSLDGYDTNYRTESYLGRVRYNYADKYNVEVSFRRDGSSRFYKDNRWGNFGSIGANWLISEEDFLKPISWINNLKLRANWGQVGNDAGAGYYGYMPLYTAEQNANKGAYYISQYENKDLKWETGEAWGIGLEGRLFKRWNISVEYFDKQNKDLLFDVYLPLSAGANDSGSASATITKNIGIISNHGIEINTDIDVYRSKDWKVNLGTSTSLIKNEIVKLPEENKDGIISGNYKIVEGKSRYEFFLPTFAGVDQWTGKSLYKADLEKNYVKSGETTIGNTDGTNITADVTKIGDEYYVHKTTYALKEFHGSSLPKIFGSFTGSVAYKSLSLSALFTYALGGKTYDGVYSSMMGTGSAPSSYHVDITNSWKAVPEGITETSENRIDPNGIPMINYDLSADNNATSSRWLTSSDYLVLKNITLSYQLPKRWVKVLDLQDIGISANCENLFTLTARQGMNPQQAFDGSQYNYLVTPRVFSIGVNIKL
jgi:TonB-linked SusC/RagA family outer membrane protein